MRTPSSKDNNGSKLYDTLADGAIKIREEATHYFKNHKASIAAWNVAFFICCCAYFYFSTQKYAFYLTLASMVQCFALFMVLHKIEYAKSVNGLSSQMLEFYVVAYSCRLISILSHQGYLPNDSSGNFFYQMIEISSLSIAGFLLYRHMFTYNEDLGRDMSQFPRLLVYGSVAILALLFHPSRNRMFLLDISWTFALYLEAFAFMPQIKLFIEEKHAENFVSHFIAAQFVATVISLRFWMKSYSEISGDNTLTGWLVLGAKLLQALLLVDFFLKYLKAAADGSKINFYYIDDV